MRKELENSEMISLLAVYEEEWRYRDEIWFSRMFRFFMISFVVILFPYLEKYLQIEMPGINKIAFPAVGIVIATVSFAVSLMYARRLHALSDTIQKINACFDEKYRMVRIQDKGFHKLLKIRICYLLTYSIYIIEIAMAMVIIKII